MAERSNASELVRMREEAMRDVEAEYRKQKKRKTYKNVNASVRAKRKEGDISAEIYHQTGRALDLAWRVAKGVGRAIRGYWQSGEGQPAGVGGILLGESKARKK